MVNWGIIGFGRMGLTFANAIEEIENSKLISIASKSGKKFKDYQNSTYEEIINSKDINSVYVSTLNNTHIDIINKLCDANKNILCEKPVSTNYNDLRNLHKKIQQKQISFFEAIAYYSHPQTLMILELIESGEIGEIKKIESNFGFKAKYKPESRLFDKKLGGGAIYDLGCYPISFAMLFSKDHNKIKIQDRILDYAPSKVDNDAKATLICDDSFECKIHVSINNDLDNTCKIHGSKGYIKVLDPWVPKKESQVEISNNKHFYLKNISSKISIYANQIKNVSDFIISEKNKSKNLFDIKKSLINMKLVEDWLKN